MARKSSATVPNDITEEYYQISPEVLNSFPKFRLPIGLYVFNESIAVLQPYSHREQRLSNEQVEEVQNLCKEGNLFVARSDFPHYSEYIIKQLDIILQDSNLKEGEVAELCIRSLTMHYNTFSESPVKANFAPMYEALMATTEWIWQDRFRLKVFMRRLPRGYSLGNHALNSMVIGLWLWLESTEEANITRRGFDRMALSFFLHDLGMSKIPPFILQRNKRLTTDERSKVNTHPTVGFKIMQKIDLAFNELSHAIMEHHERLDGSGYPQGLKGSQINIVGRICAVADAFSSMIAERPYTGQKNMEEAAKELAANEAQFDKTYTAKLLLAIMSHQIEDA